MADGMVHRLQSSAAVVCRNNVTGGKLPYTEDLAFRDWAPYTFLDGFHGDPNTRGFTNERAFEVLDGGSTALEVLLPEGCVTGECAMQAKNRLLLPVESATLKYRRAARCPTMNRTCFAAWPHSEA